MIVERNITEEFRELRCKAKPIYIYIYIYIYYLHMCTDMIFPR